MCTLMMADDVNFWDENTISYIKSEVLIQFFVFLNFVLPSPKLFWKWWELDPYKFCIYGVQLAQIEYNYFVEFLTSNESWGGEGAEHISPPNHVQQ